MVHINLRKLLISCFILVLLTTIVNARITVDQMSPSFNNEYIQSYPTKLRTYVYSDVYIKNCTYTVGDSVKVIYFDSLAQQSEVNNVIYLPTGSYNSTILCYDNNNNNSSETLTFNVDSTMIFQEQNNQRFLLWILAVMWILLFLAHWIVDENIWLLITDGLLLLVAIGYPIVTNTHDFVFWWIPITISLLILLDSTLYILGIQNRPVSRRKTRR